MGLLVLGVLVQASPADDGVTNIDKKATHQQTRIIQLEGGESSTMKVNAFCLNREGNLVAACGTGPGEVRVIDDQGQVLHRWSIDVCPEAIAAADDGKVLVGGEGKIYQFTSTGATLLSAESPNLATLRENEDAIREEAINYLKQRSGSSTSSLESRIRAYQQIIDRITEKQELGTASKSELRTLTMLTPMLEKYQKQLDEEAQAEPDSKGKDSSGLKESEIESMVKSLINSKRRISSISTDGQYIYVAVGATKGYGYSIWRLSQSLAVGEEIVSELRGCCGQMDVQACKQGVYVAENSRKRVVHYDSQGRLVKTWGKADRTGIDGFTSCCNPMNVCFSRNGDVFTAESNSGRIKRFSAEGEFLDFVGDVKLVPGCKNVSIAASPDGNRIYMLDITRNHIVVMQARDASQDSSSSSPLESVKRTPSDTKQQLTRS